MLRVYSCPAPSDNDIVSIFSPQYPRIEGYGYPTGAIRRYWGGFASSSQHIL